MNAQQLDARPLAGADGAALAARCAAVDPGDLAGSPRWLEAAGQALGASRLVHVALLDRGGATVGHLALQRARAGWRSGAPGRPILTWPMQAIGYGFRPRWLDGSPRAGWLAALRRAFPATGLELRHCDPGCLDRADDDWLLREGPATWTLRAPGAAPAWLASLRGKHRRDLAKYRRDIAAAGGEWIDSATADRALLDACFALHRSRLHDKGKRSAYFAATAETFLRALAALAAGDGLRLSLLRREGRFVAACLSFVHARRFKAFVSGWDRTHARLDLGRQVLYHQLLAELPRGLAEIDFLGGDLAYKREFGLQPTATVDAIAPGGAFAALCAQLVDGALGVYRRTRGRPSEVR